MIGKQQILELTKRREALYKFLHIQDKQIELKELEEKSNQIEFWDNPKQAQKLLKKLSVLKSWIKSYCLMENYIEELKVLVGNKFSDENLYKLFVDSVLGFDSSIIEPVEDVVMEF